MTSVDPPRIPQAWLPRIPASLAWVARRQGARPSRYLLVISIAQQQLRLFERAQGQRGGARFPPYRFRRRCRVSTSAWGVSQKADSQGTPLGLHRVARKIGGGQPVGTVYRGRQVVGRTWQGLPEATIVHRILWLEGLEPGFNRGGEVDSYRRYIYLHGFGNELTLGQPCSHGCIHLAAADLVPLFDLLPVGTLVWIGRE